MEEALIHVTVLAVIFGPLALMIFVAFATMRALRGKSWYPDVWLLLLAVSGVWTWWGVRDYLSWPSGPSPGGFGAGWEIIILLPRWYVRYAPGVAAFLALLLCWPKRQKPDEPPDREHAP